MKEIVIHPKDTKERIQFIKPLQQILKEEFKDLKFTVYVWNSSYTNSPGFYGTLYNCISQTGDGTKEQALRVCEVLKNKGYSAVVRPYAYGDWVVSVLDIEYAEKVLTALRARAEEFENELLIYSSGDLIDESEPYGDMEWASDY